jgi:hypothetical protein
MFKLVMRMGIWDGEGNGHRASHVLLLLRICGLRFDDLITTTPSLLILNCSSCYKGHSLSKTC